MAGKTSKNQRVVKKTTHDLASGASTVITPLNRGRHAYVSNGSTVKHVETSSDAFLDAIRNLDEKNRAHVPGELAALHERYPDNGWDKTLARLEAAEVL